MNLLMDVGNTNIKIGLANEKENIKTWRIKTDTSKTADEFGMIIYDLFRQQGFTFDQVEGIIISSVAPSINYTLEHMCLAFFKKKPIMVSSNLNTSIKLDYQKAEIGADRIVNAQAAYSIYGGAVITVDFGSATTFGVVDDKGVFLGGLIAPGIKASMESLVNTTAKLPRIELNKPERVIGKNTVENMQSGLILGFTGLVKYILDKIKEEAGFEKVKVVATGGMSQLVTQNDENMIDVVDRALSLKGLRILYEMNK